MSRRAAESQCAEEAAAGPRQHGKENIIANIGCICNRKARRLFGGVLGAPMKQLARPSMNHNYIIIHLESKK